ncbi:MAG TPA: TlyA family RNA methyltransferase [Actinomycetota bacterium]|nr:TlyA family RNA methyltransferase [Actinomycetota bacterium]
MSRRRLDAELVRRGLAPSRARAREAVTAGQVRIAGITATKPATLVAEDAPVEIAGSVRPFVSRGGSKLAAALDRFGIDPEGRSCLDAGASTGGFTDCLLRRGAARVIAVDVGYGQLAWELRSDPRVVVMDRTNVRTLTREALPFEPELVVADLSFISLGSVLPALAQLGTDTAGYVVLVKPQFEAGRESVGRGGVVRDPEVWRRVLVQVGATARAVGLGTAGVMASPLPGPAGNVEFLLELRRGRTSVAPASPRDVEAAIAEGEALRP